MSTNQEATLSQNVGSVGRRVKILGFITIFLGLAAITAPAIAGLSVVVTVGILVIAGGILRMIWAFGQESFGKGLLTFAIGGLTLLCGVTLVTDPLVASGFLTILIAIFLIIDGLAEIGRAFALPVVLGRGWMLFGGVVSIILGVMIWMQFPLSGLWAFGVLLGIKLLFIGIIMVTTGSAVRQLAKSADA